MSIDVCDFYLHKLSNLQQLSTVESYEQHFKILQMQVLTKYWYLEESYFVDCCIQGFIKEIQEVVVLFSPSSVESCFKLALMKETLLTIATASMVESEASNEIICQSDNIISIENDEFILGKTNEEVVVSSEASITDKNDEALPVTQLGLSPSSVVLSQSLQAGKVMATSDESSNKDKGLILQQEWGFSQNSGVLRPSFPYREVVPIPSHLILAFKGGTSHLLALRSLHSCFGCSSESQSVTVRLFLYVTRISATHSFPVKIFRLWRLLLYDRGEDAQHTGFIYVRVHIHNRRLSVSLATTWRLLLYVLNVCTHCQYHNSGQYKEVLFLKNQIAHKSYRRLDKLDERPSEVATLAPVMVLLHSKEATKFFLPIFDNYARHMDFVQILWPFTAADMFSSCQFVTVSDSNVECTMPLIFQLTSKFTRILMAEFTVQRSYLEQGSNLLFCLDSDIGRICSIYCCDTICEVFRGNNSSEPHSYDTKATSGYCHISQGANTLVIGDTLVRDTRVVLLETAEMLVQVDTGPLPYRVASLPLILHREYNCLAASFYFPSRVQMVWFRKYGRVILTLIHDKETEYILVDRSEELSIKDNSHKIQRDSARYDSISAILVDSGSSSKFWTVWNVLVHIHSVLHVIHISALCMVSAFNASMTQPGDILLLVTIGEYIWQKWHSFWLPASCASTIFRSQTCLSMLETLSRISLSKRYSYAVTTGVSNITNGCISEFLRALQDCLTSVVYSFNQLLLCAASLDLNEWEPCLESSRETTDFHRLLSRTNFYSLITQVITEELCKGLIRMVGGQHEKHLHSIGIVQSPSARGCKNSGSSIMSFDPGGYHSPWVFTFRILFLIIRYRVETSTEAAECQLLFFCSLCHMCNGEIFLWNITVQILVQWSEFIGVVMNAFHVAPKMPNEIPGSTVLSSSRQIFSNLVVILYRVWVAVVFITHMAKFSPYVLSEKCFPVLGTIQLLEKGNKGNHFYQLAHDGSGFIGCRNTYSMMLLLQLTARELIQLFIAHQDVTSADSVPSLLDFLLKGVIHTNVQWVTISNDDGWLQNCIARAWNWFLFGVTVSTVVTLWPIALVLYEFVVDCSHRSLTGVYKLSGYIFWVNMIKDNSPTRTTQRNMPIYFFLVLTIY